MPVAGVDQRRENLLNLTWPARFEGDIDERISQADAVIRTIELKLNDVGVMCGNQPRELMK